MKKGTWVCLQTQQHVDYTDTRFSTFANEHLRENEKVHKTVFACSYGAQVESIQQKINVENLVTLSL